jgi:hypothetical protein
MTGYQSKKTAAQDKLAQPEQEALKLALEALKEIARHATTPWEDEWCGELANETLKAINALAQPAQEPVAYDKTEINKFVQDLYDKKMQEGKHGHYETMFHVVHQAIKRVSPPAAQPAQEPQRPWVGLTEEERKEIALEVPMDAVCITEAKLEEKNT